MTVLRYKSAKYSIERPLHIGAALAGAGPETMAELTAFGLPLGEAFQLRDDLLGVFGDPDATGKPAGDDLIEGKRTVLVALALDAAGRDDAARLDASLGRSLDEDQVAELRGVIDFSGAHEQVEAVIGELSGLAPPPWTGLAWTTALALRELASAATDRGLTDGRRLPPGDPSVQARQVVDLRGVAGRLSRERPTLSPSPRSSTANRPPFPASARAGARPAWSGTPARSARANGPHPSQSSSMPLLSAATTSFRQPARASRSLPQSSGKASAEVSPLRTSAASSWIQPL